MGQQRKSTTIYVSLCSCEHPIVNGHGGIKASSVEQIVDKVLELPERQRLQILALLFRKKKERIRRWSKDSKDGYVRVRVDRLLR